MKSLDDIANILSEGIKKNKSASLIVCGGNSPINTYIKLSKLDINWRKINIILCDDRDVEITSDLSNERSIFRNLIINKASIANYISLRNNPSEVLKYINKFDVSILGYGRDGHFASIFPDYTAHKTFISKEASPDILYTDLMGDPLCKRITMNLSMILKCKNILILDVIERRDVLAEAKKNKKMPLYYLLNSDHESVDILNSN
tara:strand:+ start:82 stop:693 length:612 start_codon:yes stop_codon:yes gene_type:complete